MNTILSYFVKTFAGMSLSLKKKGLLVGKPWAFVDNNGEIQKLIFNRDRSLILSKNGVVTEGSWDYYPEAKVLLIDRGNSKLLLKELFIDDNVLILKIDGTGNNFFTLANENTIPDYNIPGYLNSLKCIELKIKEIELLNGNIIQIYNSKRSEFLNHYFDETVELRDNQYNPVALPDDSYYTKDKRTTFYVIGGKIEAATNNFTLKLKNGTSVEIENGSNYISDNIDKKITFNGKPIKKTRLVDNDDLIYEIEGSKIIEILSVIEHEINDGSVVKIEQKDSSKINRGDKIAESQLIFPLPDGNYKIRGKWKRIKVINNIIQ